MTSKMNAKPTALDISSFFIKKGVSPLKLQKLLYYSQVWYFVKNKKLLFDDRIQAWIYGPVVYSVWSNFKYMKRSAIIPYNRANFTNLDSHLMIHLNDVWNSYGHLSGSDLVDLTHGDLPWKNSRKGLLNDQPSDKQVIIDDATTKDFVLDPHNNIPTVDPRHSLGHYSNI